MRNIDVEIIGRDNCPFCVRAVQLCEDNYLRYSYNKIGEQLTRDEVLERFPTAKTVPIILVDRAWIGGYNELKEFIESENTKEN
jgi:glutaredoxin